MTEQEKMKRGYLWGDDEENMALQAHARGIISKFNNLPPESMAIPIRNCIREPL